MTTRNTHKLPDETAEKSALDAALATSQRVEQELRRRIAALDERMQSTYASMFDSDGRRSVNVDWQKARLVELGACREEMADLAGDLDIDVPPIPVAWHGYRNP